MDKPLERQYRRYIDCHRKWLAKYAEHLKKWNNLLRNDPEAAICEAILREELANQVQQVKPGEDPDFGGLDFLCHHGQISFFVECKCLKQTTTAKRTGLPVDFNLTKNGASFYSLLSDQFRDIGISKGKQFGSNPGRMRVLAIATLHYLSGHSCFGKRATEYLITGEHKTAFRPPEINSSFFLELHPGSEDREEIQPKRQHFSAVLLCDFGSMEKTILGALHPQAAVPFDPSLLPNIPFCRLKNGYGSEPLQTEWIQVDTHKHPLFFR